MKIDEFIKLVDNSVEVFATIPLQKGNFTSYVKIAKKEIKRVAKETVQNNPDAEFNAELSRIETGERKTLYID